MAESQTCCELELEATFILFTERERCKKFIVSISPIIFFILNLSFIAECPIQIIHVKIMNYVVYRYSSMSEAFSVCKNFIFSGGHHMMWMWSAQGVGKHYSHTHIGP